MHRIRRSWLLIPGALLVAAAAAVDAWAADPEPAGTSNPIYLSVALGWSYPEPFVLDPGDGVIDYDFNATVGAVSAGITLPDHWRAELEIAFLDNAPEVLYVRGTDVELDTYGKDTLRQTNVMLSVYRDFELGAGFHPYLGAGVGASRLDLRFTEVTDPSTELDRTPIIDDSTWAFAYQVTAGVSVPLSRRLRLGLDYRYWSAPSVSLTDVAGNPIDSIQSTHSGWLRLNWKPGRWAWNPRTLADRPGADARWYVAASIGEIWAPDRDFLGIEGQLDAWDIGPMGSLALGLRRDRHWSLELEAVRRRNQMQIYDTRYDETRTKGHVLGDSLALNVRYAFNAGKAINPFVSVGVGAARIRYDLDLAAGRVPFIRDTETGALFQWQFGFDFAVTRRWTVIATYRGAITTNYTVERLDGETFKTNYLSHSTSIGARYHFARSG